MKFSISFIIFLTIICCKEIPKKTFDDCAFYNLKEPNKVWIMPGKLDEISGIALLTQQKVLCVNDEQGKLFIYDLKKETIS